MSGSLFAAIMILAVIIVLATIRRRRRRHRQPSYGRGQSQPTPAGRLLHDNSSVYEGGLIHATEPQVTDASDQLRVVMGAEFRSRPILSRDEATVFYAAEKAVQAQSLKWRVMAQVSLGEILRSPDDEAYRAINSKRVDILLISRYGEPLAAIEYQGEGHYLGATAARDAVKKEALRRAGVDYIEITPKHAKDEVARKIADLAKARLSKTASTR